MMSGSRETPALPDFLEITLKIQEMLWKFFSYPLWVPQVLSSLEAQPFPAAVPHKSGFPAPNPTALLLGRVFEEGSQSIFNFMSYLDISPFISWMQSFTSAEIHWERKANILINPIAH